MVSFEVVGGKGGAVKSNGPTPEVSLVTSTSPITETQTFTLFKVVSMLLIAIAVENSIFIHVYGAILSIVSV